MKIHPDRTGFDRLRESFNLIPVYAEIMADTVTPISAYLNVVGTAPGFLLESVEGGEKVGRYSFIGLEPSEIFQTDGKDPLDEVEKRLASFRAYRDPELPRFLGGAVGYIGYDCVRYFEEKLTRREKKSGIDFPEAAFMLTGKLVVFDHLKRRVIIIVNADTSSENAYDRACSDIAAMAVRLRTSSAVEKPVSVAPSPVKSNMGRAEYEAAVRKAQEYIAAGDAFQIVLSQRFEKEAPVRPFEIYRALRAINPSPYMYYLNFDAFAIAGSSPEVMVRLEDRKITLRPIAGTRPRGKNAEQDALLEKELLADKKEVAEHVMLVDLGRNDVGRVARAGSVVVDEFMKVERYSHVMHIVSNVTGELSEGKTVYDLIRSAFPAGTVSGAPKIRAMEIIDELEPTRRGPYAGAVGYIGFDGNSDTAICLRTVLVKDGTAYVQAGAGIVYDSIPENEFRETENKARGMLKALEWAEAGLS